MCSNGSDGSNRIGICSNTNAETGQLVKRATITGHERISLYHTKAELYANRKRRYNNPHLDRTVTRKDYTRLFLIAGQLSNVHQLDRISNKCAIYYGWYAVRDPTNGEIVTA